MKAFQLRQSILQAAVEGELVPQNIHDEPAFKLLERIRQEKARLVKEGKIKKEKPLKLITEDEIPYDLPDGWVWCRLTDIVSMYDGAIRRGPFGSAIRKDMFVPYTGDEYKVYEQGNAIRKTVDYGTYYISEKHYSKLKSFIVVPGDIIISCAGTLGETFVIPAGAPKGIINQALLKLNINHEVMSVDFFLVLFKAIIQQQIVLSSLGSAMKNLTSIAWLKEAVVYPLPPLAEQQRIVAKVDELMALCDELETAEKELDALENHFAEYLPKSILQAAVQGKLVSQNVHDEPASELLKRIQQEKAWLIKEGKIKKGKPLPPIVEDEIPYDLPDGWAWCRLGDIVNLTRGITFPASAKSKEILDGFVRCATTGSVQKEYNPLADVFVPATYVKNENQWLQKNDIMMSSANSKELVGKSCIWNAKERTAFGGFLTVIRSYSTVCLSYLYYGLQFLQKSGVFASYSTQTTNIANLNNDMINNTLFPLPSLAEQQRIVAKVDELMALCDELKAAKDISVRRTASNIVPFPQPGEDELEIGIAARGEIQGLSDEAAHDIKELFGDDCNG